MTGELGVWSVRTRGTTITFLSQGQHHRQIDEVQSSSSRQNCDCLQRKS